LSDVTAEITNQAAVTAQNNVAVLATNNDTITDIAGSAGVSLDMVGVGLAVAVNQIGGDTTARINGGSSVTALAKSASDTLSVNTGVLATPIDVGAIQAPKATPPSLAETKKNVTGLAVNATSAQALTVNAGAIGISLDTAAGAANVAVNLLGGSTTATIDGASINQNPPSTPAARQQVDVNARSHSFAGSFIFGLAASP